MSFCAFYPDSISSDVVNLMCSEFRIARSAGFTSEKCRDCNYNVRASSMDLPVSESPYRGVVEDDGYGFRDKMDVVDRELTYNVGDAKYGSLPN